MIKVHQAMSKARLDGYSWGDIDSYLGDKQGHAVDEGYYPQEINEYLGYSDPQRLRDRLAAEASVNYATAP